MQGQKGASSRMQGKKILGIIPARGGSKGVPRKNLRPLCGKPLIAYTIEAALKSRIDRVIVSTDDTGIAETALSCGGEVPFLRPAYLAEDTVSSLSVLLHALRYVETRERYFPDIIAFLQPTSPFRNSSHIDSAVDLLLSSSVDSVIGICEVRQHPYVMFDRMPDGRLFEFMKLRQKPLRRQDFPELYLINSSMYVSRRSYFEGLSDPEPVFSRSSLKGVIMDPVSSIDIDNKLDFLFAEAAIPIFKGESRDYRGVNLSESRAAGAST